MTPKGGSPGTAVNQALSDSNYEIEEYSKNEDKEIMTDGGVLLEEEQEEVTPDVAVEYDEIILDQPHSLEDILEKEETVEYQGSSPGQAASYALEEVR